jgi:hypothetical protein
VEAPEANVRLVVVVSSHSLQALHVKLIIDDPIDKLRTLLFELLMKFAVTV